MQASALHLPSCSAEMHALLLRAAAVESIIYADASQYVGPTVEMGTLSVDSQTDLVSQLRMQMVDTMCQGLAAAMCRCLAEDIGHRRRLA